MATTPPDLAFAFGLPPERAIEYFRSKGYEITWNWHDQWQDAQAKGFTVAKAMRLDILTEIRAEVDRALTDGTTFADFQKNLTPRLQALGWWGKQIIVDSAGNAREAQMGSPRRLATIYRTNLQTAMMAGRYRAMMENVDQRPWWEYVAVMDSRTRPTHAALNGVVARYDDPFWQFFYPPNGFNCRCRVRAYSDGDVKARGLTPIDGKRYLGETWKVEPSTGFTERVATLKLPGWSRAASPDLGWSYNPGAAVFGNDVALMRKISAVKDRDLRVQAIQTINDSASRQAAFADWVTAVLAARRPTGDAQTVGIMTEAVADYVRSKGLEPAQVITLTDRSLLHADRSLHQQNGTALSPQEYQALPQLLAEPQAVLWDVRHRNLLYVGPSATDDRASKVAVALSYKLKKKGVVDEIVNAYKVDADALRNPGSYQVIEGRL
ncbi:MAG: phage minor head protein [Rhodocyclaceae bacterium]|nr:phage minor head protein [Rhodocyclaceae bacterium]